ncbi:MAG: GxxExxY protein [Usitatibacter sp.]
MDSEIELGCRDQRTYEILSCAIDVHRELGPGLLESAYRSCLVRSLCDRGLAVREEVPISILYRGHEIEGAYRADLIVEDAVLIEVKSASSILPIHGAQVLTYLKFLHLKVGLLINFNVLTLMRGVRRFAM